MQRSLRCQRLLTGHRWSACHGLSVHQNSLSRQRVFDLLARRDAHLRQELSKCWRHIVPFDLFSGQSIQGQLGKIRFAQRARIPGEQRLSNALGRGQSGVAVHQTGHFSR